MTTDVRWKSASKVNISIDPRLHGAHLDSFREWAKEGLLKRRSAPPGGFNVSELQTNSLPSQFPPVVNQRSTSPLKYASFKRVGLNSRYSSMPKSFAVSSKVIEEKPTIFNPEPVPFVADKLRCSSLLKKVPLTRQLKDGVPYGVYCSPAMLSRTQAFVLRSSGRQHLTHNATRSSESACELKSREEMLSSFLMSPNKSKVPFFHASRALLADPPGLCIADKNEDPEEQVEEPTQCVDESSEISKSEEEPRNADEINTGDLLPLNEADDLPPTEVGLRSLQEGTFIFWPPPPPPVSTDVTMIFTHNS